MIAPTIGAAAVDTSDNDTPQVLRRVDVRIPLRVPVRGIPFRNATLVRGTMGWGESSPLLGYPVAAANCDRSAIEAAVLGLPDTTRTEVPVNALIPEEDPAAAAEHALRAVEDGFTTLKLKVGDDDEVDRVAAVRAAVGDEIAIRLDANGLWPVEQARDRVQRLARFDPEYIEEPVYGLERMAQLRPDVTVKIAADESVRSIEDAQRLATLEAADVLVVKVQACGGALAAIRWAQLAEVPTVVTSMIETSVG
ncbi:MAG: enolase C-terminal domain-like protein, partial [Acidimicrobiia bacterium]|nr:enolase C-terminal domain-like protein [Acidimicrobiia bacterium]